MLHGPDSPSPKFLAASERVCPDSGCMGPRAISFSLKETAFFKVATRWLFLFRSGTISITQQVDCATTATYPSPLLLIETKEERMRFARSLADVPFLLLTAVAVTGTSFVGGDGFQQRQVRGGQAWPRRHLEKEASAAFN
eukprot:scaffold145547_cov16-Tisochrysis_lutea.AAC.1